MVHFQYNTPCWREKQTKQLKVEGTVVPVVRVFAGWRRPQFNMQHSQDALTRIRANFTRAMATSEPDVQISSGTWSSFQTFVHHYQLDSNGCNQAFGRKGLQAVGVLPLTHNRFSFLPCPF